MTNTAGRVRQITAQELKSLLDAGTPLELWDVRTEAERDIARIEGVRHLDARGVQHIEYLGRDTLLVFRCHHGIRGQAAAEHFVAKGFANVCNLVGGIDAWSTVVNASVARY